MFQNKIVQLEYTLNIQNELLELQHFRCMIRVYIICGVNMNDYRLCESIVDRSKFRKTIEIPKEQLTTEDTNEVETLKTQIQDNEQYVNVFQRLLKHIGDNGYIDFNSYKADKELFEDIKTIKNND